MLLGRSHAFTSRLRLIPTAGKDGLTVFDLARFFLAQFQPEMGVLIWITERGPYSESEEARLFDAYLRGNNVDSKECLWFEKEDSDALVATIALGILFRWDFLLVESTAHFVAEHSRDNGLGVYRASKETLNSLSALGFDSKR